MGQARSTHAGRSGASCAAGATGRRGHQGDRQNGGPASSVASGPLDDLDGSCSSGWSSSSESDAESDCAARRRANGASGTSTPASTRSLNPGAGSSAAGAAAPGAVVRSASETKTPDGWRLYLHRVSPPSGTPPRDHPVILCPGLASGGIESYDLQDSVSLAKYLAERGFDVWVPDLRGNGRSDRPKWWNRKTWWTVDEHLSIDMPTVIQAVREATGAGGVHWVGHSMGGMLAVGALSRGMACASALRSVTLVASGCFGAGGWHSPIAPLLTALATAGFHAGHIVPFLAGLRGPLAPFAWATRALFFVERNVDAAIGRVLLKRFLSFIPAGVVAQFMGSLNHPEGIASSDGAWRYADPKALAHASVPVLGVSGDRDLFCPAAGGLKTVNLFGGPRRFLLLGPAYGTARHHYGHFCPLVGRNVHTEVYPHISAFLAEFDAPAAATGAAVADAPGSPFTPQRPEPPGAAAPNR